MPTFQTASCFFLSSFCAMAALTAVPAYAQYTFQTIDDPSATTVAYPNDGTGTDVTGINNAGQIVGFYVDGTGYHGFLKTNSSFKSVDVPGAETSNYGAATFAYGINNNGLIVGRYDGPTVRVINMDFFTVMVITQVLLQLLILMLCMAVMHTVSTMLSR